MKYLVLFALPLFWGGMAQAQGSQAPARYWSLYSGANDASTQQRQAEQVPGYAYVTLNLAPMRQDWAASRQVGQAWPLELPLPGGQTVTVMAQPTGLLAPELAAKYPGIQVFEGESADGAYQFRGDLTHNGFHGQLLTTGETYYIDPAPEVGPGVYLSYARSAYINQEKIKPFIEGPLVTPIKPREDTQVFQRATSVDDFFAGETRTYRIAIAATGEYTSFHGGTKAAALSGITTTLNRVTGIYERDLGISFTLVANNDEIVYTSSSTDPYTNGSAGAILDENQTVLDDIIGTANYDIGHVFSTGSGGLAAIYSTCNDQNKAQGTTGTSSPSGDAFDIDYVAHEIGHQMGATHTFNGTQGSCAGGNRMGGSAYEPGSGSTIMAYANICGSDNIQSFSDDYFHNISVQQMAVYTLLDAGYGCAQKTADGNRPPVTHMPTGGWTIPISTPFALTGGGSDPDGDALTFAWEQFDLGPGGAPDAVTGSAPLFRSFLPTSDSIRVFPQLSDILSGVSTVGEVLPDYARELNFMLTVRDGNGGMAYDPIKFEVDDAAGPFVVNAPAQGTSASVGGSVLVTWDVANTNLPPFGATNVQISLSVDGGQTFTHVLADTTANDGSEYVTLPGAISTTSQAIIKVSAVGNIFFNLSPGLFTITNDGSPAFSATVTPVPQEVCSPNDAVYTVTTTAINGFSNQLTLATQNLPGTLSSSFGTTTLAPGESTTLTIGNTTSATLGDNGFQLTLTPSGGGTAQTLEVPLQVITEARSDLALVQPIDGEASVETTVQFQWEADNSAAYYEIQIARDDAFTDIVEESSNLPFNRFQPSAELELGTNYFWRIRAINSCNTGGYTSGTFRTLPLTCNVYTSTDVPINITTDGDVTYESTLAVTDNPGDLYSVRVMNLDVTHTWVSDLVVSLVGPNNIAATLINSPCSREDDILMSFGDGGAPHSDIPCPPTDGGLYQPLSPLSVFEGVDAQGTWTLTVLDQAAEDGGSINGWGLQVCILNSDITAQAQLTNDSTVEVTWVNAAPDGVTGYQVQSSANNAPFAVLGTTDASTFTFTDADLPRGTVYQYRVRSMYGDGSFGEFSRAVRVQTPDVLPVAPTSLIVTSLLDYQAELGWQDMSDNEDGFIIQRSENDSLNFVTIDTAAEGMQVYVDPARPHDGNFFYRVAAYNTAGVSAFTSAVGIVITDLEVPFSAMELSVYPNPGERQVTLSLGEAVNVAAAQVRLHSLQGRTVWQGQWTSPSTPLTVEAQQIPSGVYLIQVQTNEGVLTQRWVKQ